MKKYIGSVCWLAAAAISLDKFILVLYNRIKQLAITNHQKKIFLTSG